MSTPEEWRRIKAIAGEAWARPVAERAQYIASACAGDEVLDREVSLLVAAMVAAEGRFEVSPSINGAEAPSPANWAGRRLGAYELIAPLGAGGMGEVYKARDTRLNRIVAIKVLPTGLSSDALLRARMEREARAIAALNSPHICTLYDVGSEDGVVFLVMEHLEGETLAACLARGKLPVAETLGYAIQIASALAEAHRAGIVHRDVKPANIMLERTRTGPEEGRHVKLLDFGIARAGAPDVPAGPRPAESGAALDLTLPGALLGTAHYMAPEQIDGHATDARTDIFALGAVLFEMLTGRKAFEGAGRAEVLAAIRRGDIPRVSSLPSAAPAALDRIVARCLARDPDDRYQAAVDLMADLHAVRRRLESSPRARMLLGAAAAGTLVIAGFSASLVWNDSPESTPPSVVTLAASAGVRGAPALSPDGASVVFSWAGEGVNDPELVLLRIGSTVRVRLTNVPGLEDWPVWSPDGAEIAFVRCTAERCGIFALPLNGGPERRLRELRNDRYYGLAWSRDGRHIAYAERSSSSEPYALFLLSTDTLAVRRLITTPGFTNLRFAFSPDGRRLAVIRIGNADIGVDLIWIDTGTTTSLLSGQQEWFGGIAWSADGRFLILSANQRGVRHLWKLPVTGGALEQLAIAGENAYFPTVSARGDRLAFVRELRDWDLSQAALNEHRQDRAPFPLTSSPRIDLDPAFSPDGGKLAFISERGGTRELWVSDADGANALQLTSMGGRLAGRPSWSPDGRFVAFHSDGIDIVAAAGGPPRKIFDGAAEMPSWSADGRWVYFRRTVVGQPQIWRVPADGGEPVQAIGRDAMAAQEGPQGRDLYFVRPTGGIWRRSIAGGDETLVIPGFKGSLPGYWTVVNDGIYYVDSTTPTDKAVANRIRFFRFANGRTVDVGTLSGVIEDWVGGMTISSDRRTVVYSHLTYQSSEVVLVEHFR